MANQQKIKGFDCVEMKQNAQEKLKEEYERRKHEFADFVDFINKKAVESPWKREMLAKFGKASSKKASA